MTFTLLSELASSLDNDKPFIDKICKLLFRREGEKLEDGYGVENAESILIPAANGAPLKLTFDNTNTQKEYELNSLTPLGIERGSDVVQELERMYKEHGVASKAGLSYVSKGGKMVLRGINFGKRVDEKVLRMVQDAMVMLSHDFKKTA